MCWWMSTVGSSMDNARRSERMEYADCDRYGFPRRGTSNSEEVIEERVWKNNMTLRGHIESDKTYLGRKGRQHRANEC